MAFSSLHPSRLPPHRLLEPFMPTPSPHPMQITRPANAGHTDTGRTDTRPRGWLLGTLLLLGMAWACLSGQAGVDGWRLLIRATARTSLLCFLLAYVAQAAVLTWPGPLTQAWRRQRRTWGWLLVSSHALHAWGIVMLAEGAPALFETLSPPASRWGPALAYGFIVLMGLTSFDRTAAWLGPKAWSRLHTWGSHFLWLSFLVAYARRVPLQPVFLLPCVLLLAALAWRLWARRHASQG